MITITTPRQFAEFADLQMFPYLDLIADSQLMNLKGVGKTSDEYLLAIMIISLIAEIKMIVKRRLINSQSKTLKIKMSTAQGIAFYKTLLTLPVPDSNFYFNRIRNLWIETLDQQIVK